MKVNKQSRSFFYHCYAGLCIVLALVVGKTLHTAIGGLPGSLYGMIIFALCLKLNWVNAARVQPTIQLILLVMGVCFVPAGVGIIDELAWIMPASVGILASVCITTLLTLTVVGLLAKWLLPNTLPSGSEET